MARGMSGKFLSSLCTLSTRDEAPIVTRPSVRFGVCSLLGRTWSCRRSCPLVGAGRSRRLPLSILAVTLKSLCHVHPGS